MTMDQPMPQKWEDQRGMLVAAVIEFFGALTTLTKSATNIVDAEFVDMEAERKARKT